MRLVLVILFGFVVFGTQAQMFHKQDESVFPFRVSLGYNFINESISMPSTIMKAEGWNAVAYPSQIGVERIVSGDLSLEGVFSYNEYLPGKIIDGKPADSKIIFRAYDLNFKYSLRNVFGGGNPYKTTFINHFEPNVILGFGYDKIGDQGLVYGNLGGNLVYWFSDDDDFAHNYAHQRVGMFGQALMKVNGDNNLAQISLGLIYKFK